MAACLPSGLVAMVVCLASCGVYIVRVRQLSGKLYTLVKDRYDPTTGWAPLTPAEKQFLSKSGKTEVAPVHIDFRHMSAAAATVTHCAADVNSYFC